VKNLEWQPVEKGTRRMVPPIDIFEMEEATVRWIGAAATVEDAKEEIRKLAAAPTGRFILLDQRTGKKVYIESGEVLEQGDR
jgi:hypothetical protein